MPTAQAAAAPKPPPFRIVRSERKRHYLDLMVFGGYGAGKTTLASTALEVPGMADVLYLDVEGGTLVLPDGVDLIPARSWEEASRVKEFLRLHCRARDAGDLKKLAALESQLRGEEVAPGEAKQYHTFVVDSLSELHTHLMYMILGIDYETQALDIEPEGAEGKDWQTANELMLLFVRTLRDLPMNIILICGEQEVEVGKGDNKKISIRPALPGKLATKVQGFLQAVGYLETAYNTQEKSTMRRLWLQSGHPRFQAKMRLPREIQHLAPKYLDDPTLGALMDITERLAQQAKTIKETDTDASNTDSTNGADNAAASPRTEARSSRADSAARSGSGRGRVGGRRGSVRSGARGS